MRLSGLQVPPNGSGSLVFKIDPMAPAIDVLKENDVVLEIEGVPIADDGTVEFRNEERVEFSHIVRSKHIGMAYATPCLPHGSGMHPAGLTRSCVSQARCAADSASITVMYCWCWGNACTT